MNKTLIAGTLACTVLTAPATHARSTFDDYAEVLDVEPLVHVVEVSTPHEECWDEEVRHRERRAEHGAAPVLLGSLIGAVVGHNIGYGRGRKAARITGALIGASIGHDQAHHHGGGYERVSHERVCETVYESRTEERVDGYRVTYRYHGETFETRLPYDPGDTLRIKVNVRPAKY